jgi:hypothetical protein
MKPLTSVLPYLAWIVSGILTVLDWMALRELVVAIAVKIAKTVPMEKQIERGWFLHSIIPVVDRSAVLVLGVIGLALVLSFDYIYRTGLAKGVLRKRFGLITAIQVGVWVMCQGVILIILD